MTTATPTTKQLTLAMTLAERLKWCRRLKGKTLRELAEETGISNAHLSQLETGKIKDPGALIVFRLAKYYGVSVDDLLA